MSDVPAGLETLDFFFSGGRPAGAFPPVLVGVVGSGNLEVMLEPPAATTARCASKPRRAASGRSGRP